MPKPSQSTQQAPRVSTAGRGSPSDTATLLKQYGITVVPKDTYEWGGYRYTNAHDAIAAAKRQMSA
jgi:hypothetical protein